jgi:hypothetical protein
MSTPPKSPERVAEILLEILALSDSARTSQSDSAGGTNRNELSDANCVEEQSQRKEEDNNGQTA